MSRVSRLSLGVFLVLCGLVLGLAIRLLISQFPAHHERPEHRRPVVRYGTVAFNPPPTGTDYYSPASYFTSCTRWIWLTGCYSTNPNGGTSAKQQLASDAAWVTTNRMGQFQRVWGMLDQGIRWNNGTYAGLDPAYLSNLDDALATLHAHSISADLVVYEASNGSSDKYQFQAQALDGSHAALRAGYLQALADLVKHLAANATDASTVVVLDLFNETYYQLERFGLSDSVIHQWMTDAYNAAKAAAPQFNYTFSDTTRLLKDYATWNAMYPGDVIDEHLYDDQPWSSALYSGQSVSHSAFWERASAFSRPWFAGEAGCSPGNVGCTYSGTASCTQPTSCALSVDTWWLTTMPRYGARAILVEDRGTAWQYPSGYSSQSPTLVGKEIQQASGSAPAVSTPPPAATTPAPTPAMATAPATAPATTPPATATSVAHITTPAPTQVATVRPTATPTTPPVMPEATLRPCPTVPPANGEREPDSDSDDGPYATATAQAQIGCK